MQRKQAQGMAMTHRAVIVKTCWKEIGAAFAVSRNGSTYYAVTFGQPIE